MGSSTILGVNDNPGKQHLTAASQNIVPLAAIVQCDPSQQNHQILT